MDLGLSEVILVGKRVTKKVYSLKESGQKRFIHSKRVAIGSWTFQMLEGMNLLKTLSLICTMYFANKVFVLRLPILMMDHSKLHVNTHHTILCCDSLIQLNLTAMAALGAEESGHCREVLNGSR